MADEIPDDFDVTEEAYWSRLAGLARLYKWSGDIHLSEIVDAINVGGTRPGESALKLAVTEKVAKWLRSEFHQMSVIR